VARRRSKATTGSDGRGGRRQGPAAGGGDGGGACGEEAVVAAQNTVKGFGSSATDADERSTKREGCLWCASKGEWGREGKGVWQRRATPFKWHGGRQGKEGASGSVPEWRREKDGWGAWRCGRAAGTGPLPTGAGVMLR
jgi:hypothetical protein